MPPYFLNGRDFLNYMLTLGERDTDTDRVHAMFCALDLELATLDRPVRAYSKGMTQKLGLAACLLAEPDLLILDEPMSGLDPLAAARVKKLLRQLRESGRTLFFHLARALRRRRNLRTHGGAAPGQSVLFGRPARADAALRREFDGTGVPEMHRR